LGIPPTPQPQIPNPQSPIPNPQNPKFPSLIKFNKKKYFYYNIYNKIKNKMNKNRGNSYHRNYNTPIPKLNNQKYRGQSLPKSIKTNKSGISQPKLPIIKNGYNNNNRNPSSFKINNHKNYDQNLFGNININKKTTNTNPNIKKYISSISESRLPIEFNDLSYDNMKE